MRQLLPRAWYKDAPWLRWLRPLSRLYGWLARYRRQAWQQGRKQAWRASVPVIVVGNLVAGGTGKTPLVLALCHYLQAKGLRPAIISRGYGGRSKTWPLAVTCDTPSDECGDEALLFALNTDVPVVVDPDRGRGVRFIEEQYHPDLVLCDDGLQHYALARDIEIVVVDGTRGFGNGQLLPAGPLREPLARLLEVDHVVVNADDGLVLPAGVRSRISMSLAPSELVNVANGNGFSCAQWLARYGAQTPRIHAVAGIGNPERFFTTLCDEGFAIIAHPFPDHHRFRAPDINFKDNLPVIMTEKDVVKCLSFINSRHWCLKVHAVLPEAFLERVRQQVMQLRATPATGRSAPTTR
jgi:tetraacyldisaccharide 4'-kinase